MKNKKRLGFLATILGLSICATPIVSTVAFADDEYTAKAGIKDIVFFDNAVDYFEKGGSVVDVAANKNLELVVEHNDCSNTDCYTYEDGIIVYKEVGTYTVTLKDNKGTEDVKDDATATATVLVVAQPTTAPAYLTGAESEAAYAKFNEDIKSAVSKVDKDATTQKFTLPESFWDLLNLGNLDKDCVVTSLYVAAPKASFSKKATDVSKLSDISLSASGTYAFYLEVKDCFGNKLVVDEDVMTQKADGWYQTFDNGTPADETDDYEQRIIPIFTFKYSSVTEPVVKVERKTEKGVVGVEYNSGKATVENASRVTVTLYYNADPNATVSVAKLDDATSGWVVATEEHATFSPLDKDYLRFTPVKQGAFAYRITAVTAVVGSLDDEFDVCSETIKVTTSVQEQKLVNVKFRNFVKNNWLSLIFLGIAFLCIVGIVVLAFYKPKDAEEVKAQKKAKKVAVEDPVEEAPVEEAEEAVEEAVEAEEAPVEEVEEAVEATEAEATEEAPVEETPATEEVPAEETPAEAVETEGENA